MNFAKPVEQVEPVNTIETMKIIKIFSDYCSTDVIVSEYFNIYKLFYDNDYNIKYKFTHDNNYTHAILLNKAMPELSIPKENVVGLAHEPPELLQLTNKIDANEVDYNFIEYVKKYIGKYYIGNRYDLPDEFVEGYGYLGHIPISKTPLCKTKIMSLMISEKDWTYGHRYRHQLAKVIMDNNLPIDIHGRGCKLFEPNNALKGEFDDNSRLVDEYLFTIAVENTNHPHYFSEKVINPLIRGTNVIYLGCTNIREYFKKDLDSTPQLTCSNNTSDNDGYGIYLLTGDINDDMNVIVKILNDWKKYYVKINTESIVKVVNIKNLINKL